MNAELLGNVGRILYGLQWQTDLARALEISPRTVRHWSQTGQIPVAQWRRIAALCSEQVDRLHKAIEAIGVETEQP